MFTLRLGELDDWPAWLYSCPTAAIPEPDGGAETWGLDAVESPVSVRRTFLRYRSGVDFVAATRFALAEFNSVLALVFGAKLFEGEEGTDFEDVLFVRLVLLRLRSGSCGA